MTEQSPTPSPPRATSCINCGFTVCVRQAVLNMALGAEEDFLCVRCLAQENEQLPEPFLEKTREYVLSRDCFKKEWIRYKTIADCPEPERCIPNCCFS